MSHMTYDNETEKEVLIVGWRRGIWYNSHAALDLSLFCDEDNVGQGLGA